MRASDIARAHGRWLLALGAVGLLLALSAPPWPDDWDGLGFVASIDRFDLARFSPHPPGYPVYVALLRLASRFGGHVAAANAVAVVSGVTAVALIGDALEQAKLAPRTWALAIVAVPLAWRASSAIGSEAPALACAALAVFALMRRMPIVVGVAVGLGLGVRLSWAPVYAALLLLVVERRARAWVSVACATAAWLVPLVAIVGAARLDALLRAHFAGHAARWGGTAVTEPGVGRVVLLARDVFVDGLGVDADVLGVAIAASAAALAVVGVAAWRAARWHGARAAAIVLVPYAAWIAVGQNLRQQPRHALPLVVALAASLVVVAARSSPRVRALAAVIALLVAARTFTDATSRRATPPPGAQLAEWMRDHEGVVFGTASVRFLESTPVAARAGGASTLGDVVLGIARRERPARVYATSEVRGAADGALVAELCRPPRIDRRAPCLRVYDVTEIAR